MKMRAILNSDGGTLRTLDLDTLCRRAEQIFSAKGHALECRVVGGGAVLGELKAAADDPAVEAMLAVGGDGTISAAAALAREGGKTLGVIPAGTMNLFARALGVPLDLEAALAAIAGGQVRRVDIATANGRPFVHQFGVGIHARLVRIRDGMAYGSRAGKMLASLRAILAAAADPPRFEVELSTADGEVRFMASGIAVSNNRLDDSPVPVAARLDEGVLGVYVATSVTTNQLLGLALDVITGQWRDNPAVRETEASKLVLRFPRKKRGSQAVIDGELIDLATEVTLEIHPQALQVMVPRHPLA